MSDFVESSVCYVAISALIEGKDERSKENANGEKYYCTF